MRRTAFGHPSPALFAHGLTSGAAFGGGDEAVLVGIEAGKALFGAGLDIGDDDRTAGLSPGHTVMAAGPAAIALHPTRTTVGAGFPPGLTGGVELGAVDGTVIIGVETVEAGVRAAGPARLHGGAALIGRDRAVAIRICGGQALHALSHELGLAEAAIAVSVGTHAAGRSLLGGGDTGRGEDEGGEAADEKGLVHSDYLHGRPMRPPSLSGD
jgi:hypothetical protein